MSFITRTTAFLKTNLNDRVFSLLILLVPTLVIFFASYYFLFGRGAISPLVKQSQLRQEAVVHSGTITIESLLELSRTSLVNLSFRLDDKTMLDSKTIQQHLDDFVDSWDTTPAVEAVFVDETGTLRFISKNPNYPTSDPVDVSDRDYVIWSKTAQSGETFIGTVIKTRAGAFKDDSIIPIATPVIINGQFQGTLAMAISINKLTDSFLNPVKITPNSRVYLIDSTGTLLYSPFPETQGINYITYLKEHRFLGSDLIAKKLEDTAAATGTGQLDIILPNQETGRLSRMLIAYRSINYGNGHWTLAMATPVDDALTFAVPLYLNQLFLLLIIFISILLMSVHLARKFTYWQVLNDLKRKKNKS